MYSYKYVLTRTKFTKYSSSFDTLFKDNINNGTNNIKRIMNYVK